MKVAFVTPRYGPEVMGGAETAARQLAEHLVADCGAEVEVFSTCALDHVTWEDVLEPGDSELNGVTVHRFASDAGRNPDFYGLDGKLRLAPREATRRESQRWVELNGPVTNRLLAALSESDAQVAAFYPYLYYPSVKGIGHVPMPGVLHRPLTTSRHCTCRSSEARIPTPMPSATTPSRSVGWCSGSTPSPTGPRSSSGSGSRTRRATDGAAVRCSASASGPTWSVSAALTRTRDL